MAAWTWEQVKEKIAALGYSSREQGRLEARLRQLPESDWDFYFEGTDDEKIRGRLEDLLPAAVAASALAGGSPPGGPSGAGASGAGPSSAGDVNRVARAIAQELRKEFAQDLREALGKLRVDASIRTSGSGSGSGGSRPRSSESGKGAAGAQGSASDAEGGTRAGPSALGSVLVTPGAATAGQGSPNLAQMAVSTPEESGAATAPSAGGVSRQSGDGGSLSA